MFIGLQEEKIPVQSFAIQVGTDENSAWCSRNTLTIHPNQSEIMILSRWKFIGHMTVG